MLLKKGVVIFGGGKEATFKVKKVLDEAPNVTVVSMTFSNELKQLARDSKARLVKFDLGGDLSELKRVIGRPHVAIVATDNPGLNRKVNDFVRRLGSLVCVVDTPDLCDFAMPAISRIGDVRVAISTGGTSPAMAAVLRKKIESIITETDLLQIRLQEHARKVGKRHLESFEDRRRALYRVIEDRRIGDLLKEKKLDEAKILAESIILEVK